MIEEKVLDHGFVRLEDIMGGDKSVVRAARVSYGPTPPDPVKDKKLIAFMLEHEHGTPFEHAVFTFHVQAPLFVARQWFRHRTSSYNEASQRYSIVKDMFYIPKVWRAQDTKNKQGSVAGKLAHVALTADLENGCREQMVRYNRALDAGAAKEMARFHLPVTVYTEWYWTVNARALMNFIRLRSEKHAQWEIRQYSHALWRTFAQVMPWTAEAFLATIDLQAYVAEGHHEPGPSRADIPQGAAK